MAVIKSRPKSAMAPGVTGDGWRITTWVGDFMGFSRISWG
jgi:hypothetical protein